MFKPTLITHSNSYKPIQSHNNRYILHTLHQTISITTQLVSLYLINRLKQLLLLMLSAVWVSSVDADDHDATQASPIHLHTGLISRHNYGGTFTKIPKVLMSGHSSYDVIFQVPILRSPRSILKSTYVRCQAAISCPNELSEAASNQFNSLVDEIESTNDNIRNLLHEPISFTTKQRKAKSLFNFIRSISKKLFNIATLDDIHELAQHISTLEATSSESYHEQSGILNNIVKYTNYTSARIDILEEQISNSAQQVMTIETQLQKWSEVISQSDNSIRNELDQLNRNITIRLNQLSIYSLQQINLHLQLFLNGLTTLASGILPTELVSPSDVRSALHKVHRRLHSDNRSFKMVYDDISFYAKSRQFIYIYSKLYLHSHAHPHCRQRNCL